MNQSLDGYVDHMAFAPSPTLFRHFIEEAQGPRPPLRPVAHDRIGEDVIRLAYLPA